MCLITHHDDYCQPFVAARSTPRPRLYAALLTSAPKLTAGTVFLTASLISFFHLSPFTNLRRSLGVLLYTLVYGAMPFDGSNFKRLVKQISSGDYYEPTEKPSSSVTRLFTLALKANPLIHQLIRHLVFNYFLYSGFATRASDAARRSDQKGFHRRHLLSLVNSIEHFI